MDYVVTFSDVMTALITVGGTVVVFLFKHWFTNMEQQSASLQKKVEQGNQEITQRIEKNDARVNERIDRLEQKTGADIQNIKQEINDIKGDFATTFVLREDFFRSMNGVEDKIRSIDSKLDRLLMMNKDSK
jgi:chromosome segregation ATPase